MSINIVTKDGGGNQFHPATIYTLNFSYLIGAGCEKAEILLPNEMDLPEQLDDLRIYDNTELLWLGRIEDEPLVTESGEVLITAVGYTSHLKDELVQKLWVDTGSANWDVTPPVPYPNGNNWDGTDRDNNNRVFIKVRDGTLPAPSFTGLYYRLSNSDAINQDIYSVVFDFELGGGIGTSRFGRLTSYDDDITNPVTEFSLEGDLTNQSGSTDIVLTAGKKGVAFHLANSAVITGNSSTHFKGTSLRVNGSSNFTGTNTADDFIKDIIPDFATALSTDFSDIDTGTATITDFFAENPTTPLELIKRAVVGEDWKTGIYEVGSDDKPRYRATAILRDTIDWFISVDDGLLDLAGKSIQEMFNSVVVEFLTSDGRTTTVTRTAIIDLFDNFGITKEAHIKVNTTSTTAAEEAGDQFLTEFGRPRAKGQMILKGPILSKFGNKPAWFIRPNDIIQIHDLDASPATLGDMSASTVTNGINIFEVTAVSVNISGSEESVTIQLETPASRLDFELVSR